VSYQKRLFHFKRRVNVSAFPSYAEGRLSFTDCTTIALMRRMDVESLVSFDADFDKFTSRIS